MAMLWYTITLLAILSMAKADIIAIDSQNYTDLFLDSELSFTREMVGVLVEANPPDACFNVTGRPPTLNSSIPCFVLIQGRGCSLEDKVMHANWANYSAAIIYDVEWGANYRITRSFIIANYNLTSIVISTVSAIRLIENYLYRIDPGSRILITMNHLNIISVLLLFAIVGGIFVFLMFLFMMIKCIQRSRQRSRYRLPTRYLRHIPTSKYRSGDPYETCAICLEDYKEKDRLRILPCSHAYHCKCIDPWLTDGRRTCPVCKQKVRIAGVHDDEDDSESDTDGRAESAPLIRGSERPINHGTFNTEVQVAVHSSSRTSSETTSRDAPSENLDGTPEVDVFRPSSSTEVLIPGHHQRAITSPLTYDNTRRHLIAAIDHEDGADNISQASASSGSPILKRDKTYVV